MDTLIVWWLILWSSGTNLVTIYDLIIRITIKIAILAPQGKTVMLGHQLFYELLIETYDRISVTAKKVPRSRMMGFLIININIIQRPSTSPREK